MALRQQGGWGRCRTQGRRSGCRGARGRCACIQAGCEVEQRKRAAHSRRNHHQRASHRAARSFAGSRAAEPEAMLTMRWSS